MILNRILAFQSTPPVKAATIPSPVEESDIYISIHAAREGGDGSSQINRTSYIEFQSTPPVKAATSRHGKRRQPYNISIHAAREGGDGRGTRATESVYQFQSTPPVKAATKPLVEDGKWGKFQSTPPVKAATHYTTMYSKSFCISIHAAREGGDCGNE